MNSVPFGAINNQYVVIEEKVDGANAAISFDAQGQLQLQSRGHYLTGGPRERHFNRFKQWAYCHCQSFWDVLGTRYILYGEWLYAKHTVFYDHLPHYFLEFDVLDLETQQFLSTDARRSLLQGLPIVSVPVLFEGIIQDYSQLLNCLGNSHYITADHEEHFEAICREKELDVALARQQTNPKPLMEGLYIKVECEGWVCDRYKYVRADFLTSILESESHWLDRPIIPNQLRADVDLFAM